MRCSSRHFLEEAVLLCDFGKARLVAADEKDGVGRQIDGAENILYVRENYSE